MPVIQVVLILVVLGFCLWAVQTYIPMAGPIKTLINVVVVLGLILWLLSLFGLGNLTIGIPTSTRR